MRIQVEVTRGELLTDLLSAIFAPMFTLTQMHVELFHAKEIEEDQAVDSETQKMLTTYGLPRE